jgi:hypothetical protein
MKGRYCEDTDTALVEIATTASHETRELTLDLYMESGCRRSRGIDHH